MTENELARVQLDQAKAKMRIAEAVYHELRRSSKKEIESAARKLELAKDRVAQARQRVTNEQAERTANKGESTAPTTEEVLAELRRKMQFS